MKKNKIILSIMILTVLLIAPKIKATSTSPDLLQFYNSSTTYFTRNTMTQNKFGQNFYVSTTPSTISEVRAIYGISNNKISGSIISFSLQAGQPKPTISAQIQLVDSSFINCDVETKTQDYADGTIYTAYCNIGTPQAIYKYGFMWQDSAGYNTSEGALLLTSLNAFNSETDYTAYYNQLNASITQAMIQAHSDAQQNHQDWEKFENTDLGNNQKQPVDGTAYDNTSQTEADIYDTLFDNAPVVGDVLDFTIDEQSNSWVWGTMQALVSTHTRIIGMFVAILSIGVAKMIMGR